MSGHDFSGLSYKELQALALRYRVPGNIKKKLLVKVLQAAKSGNDSEVDRLLHDLRQNRKKRVRKVKPKLNITSTPLHSPNYTMADDYYCPPQQPPYQWVGAEEEIMSRDDDNNKIPHYEEFCQFLLRRVQREFQNYNETNNNELQDPTIVDLRTVGGPSQVHTVPVDMCSYPISNIITVSESNTYAFSSNDRIQYQVLEETNGNAHGSILLKKMLQAPAGANLGEIASPLLGGYRVWSIEQSQTDNLLDNNSDTLTADSEKDENEDNFANNIECYSLVNNGRDEYFFNESNFIRNTEDLGQQFPNVLTNENQYKFGNTDIDTSQNFPNWTNTITEIGSIVPEIEASSSSTLYYDNAESNCLIKRLNTDLSGCQYNVNENASAYNTNQDAFNMSLSGDIQYCQTNIIPISQTDASNTYCLQNLTKQLRDINGVYINPINDTSHINLVQNPYIPLTTQAMPSNINHYNGLTQPHSYNNKNQQNDVLSIDPFEQHGYNNSSNNNNNNNNNSNSNNHSNNYGSSNSGNNNNCSINNNNNNINSNAHNHNHHYHHHPHNHPDSENNNNNSSNNNINISSSGNNGNINNNGNNNHSSSSSSSISNNNNHIAISNKNNGNSSSSSTSSNSSSINPKNNINYNNYNNNYNNMYNNDKQLTESNSKTMSGKAGYAFNGILDPFWPTQIFKNSTKHLENILNYRISSNVDYTKLEQTSCVYCYTAPIVAVKMGSSNLLCSQKKKYVSERREHTFSTNCLLYNDTSAGMRLSNLQVDLDMHSEDRNQTEQLIISDHDNVMMNELGDTVVDSDDSINDVWIHDYNKDSDTTLKNMGTPDDENSACFLSDMNVQDSQVDDISLN